MRRIAILLPFILSFSSFAGELEPAAPNTWVKLNDSATGGRSSPFFFYEPAMKKFILGGGAPGGGYNEAKRHFEVEIFDLETAKWINAYPPSAPYKNLSGETDAPAIGADGLKSLLVQEKSGMTRLAMFGSAYGTDSRAHFQWSYDTDSRKLIAYLWNHTLAYNPAERTWSDTNAAPFSKPGFAMIWGNLCYDPVNKEILSIGGSSDEKGGTPGTYVYKIAENVWKKVDCGSKEINDLHGKVTALRKQAWALISAARSRFFITESEAEAKASLAERATALETAAKKFQVEITAAKPAANEAASFQRAADKIADALTALKAVRLDGTIDSATISAVKAVHDEIERAELALCAEPAGRAASQPVFDSKSGKIVLFGGNGLDRCYADTWLYDPKTHSWEQRYPKLSPSPRAGHALVALPKSGKVALDGGYAINGWFGPLPHQLWSYDVAANEWKLLMSLPLGPNNGNSQNAPHGECGGNYAGGSSQWVGATNADDLLVMVDAGGTGRGTWACKIDPAKFDAAGSEKLGVPPGTMSSSTSPAEFENVKPDATKVTDFFKNLAPNTWTAINPAKMPPCRAWNSTAYDSDRHQFLWWGGGHVTYMGTDVDHYSVRSNLWTLGYAPDLPTEPTGGFYVKAALTFQDRPQVPVHAYQAYAYDPPSGKMFYLDRAYDVAERQWDPTPYPGLQHKGSMNTMLESTPNGVVAISEHGLFRFEWKEKCWKKLPWKGSVQPTAWCDGMALCYDSKRDCLWFAGKDINCYDIKTGTVEKVNVTRPKRVGDWALWREQVYVPEADLILLMSYFKGPDGKETNVAYDPTEKKYYAIEFNGKANSDRWTSAIHYDAKFGAVLINEGNGRVWALKFDRKSAKLSEISE